MVESLTSSLLPRRVFSLYEYEITAKGSELGDYGDVGELERSRVWRLRCVNISKMAIARVTDALRKRLQCTVDAMRCNGYLYPTQECTFICATQRVLSDDYVESDPISKLYPS